MDISKRLVEVDEILNYLSADDLNKIPEDVRQIIKENKDRDYIWNYDTSKSLKEQDVSSETISILSYLNMEYLLNDKQKDLMQKIYETADARIEEEKRKKYSPNDIFSSNQNDIND